MGIRELPGRILHGRQMLIWGETHNSRAWTTATRSVPIRRSRHGTEGHDCTIMTYFSGTAIHGVEVSAHLRTPAPSFICSHERMNEIPIPCIYLPTYLFSGSECRQAGNADSTVLAQDLASHFSRPSIMLMLRSDHFISKFAAAFIESVFASLIIQLHRLPRSWDCRHPSQRPDQRPHPRT